MNDRSVTTHTRKGHPNPMKGKKMSPELRAKIRAGRLAKLLPFKERFWRRVEKIDGGCWVWKGKPKRDGYGQVWTGTGPRYAHRVALDLLGIVIPEGWDADHTCRNRLCVSPYHLRAVTERVNALENNDSPFAKNARRTHCVPHGHPLSGDNVRMIMVKGRNGKRRQSRQCLACYRLRHPNTKL